MEVVAIVKRRDGYADGEGWKVDTNKRLLWVLEQSYKGRERHPYYCDIIMRIDDFKIVMRQLLSRFL